MPEYTCSQCKYYEPVNGKGKCKASAPERKVTSSLGHVNVIVDGWPEIEGNGSVCGNFMLNPI
jgi:hypothetical protein